MSEEDNIRAELIEKFGFLDKRIRIQRPRRIWMDVEPQDFRRVFDFAVINMRFCILSAITGLDERVRLGFIYHIGRENGIMLNMATFAPKDNPVIKTITGYFPAADIYEREIADLLGAKVEGLAAGKRYPLTDDWPADEFPLRKDWKANSK